MMAADGVGELERVLGNLKRQLPEGHALAAVIADEELDFEQVTELTLGELSPGTYCSVVCRFLFVAAERLISHGSVLCECSSALSCSRRSFACAMITCAFCLSSPTPPGDGTEKFEKFTKMGPRKRAFKLLRAALAGARAREGVPWRVRIYYSRARPSSGLPPPTYRSQPAAPNPPLCPCAAAVAHRRLTLAPPHTRGPPTGWLNPVGWYNGNQS